jgi:hypothetical protein
MVLHYGLNDHVGDVNFYVVADLRFQALLDGLLIGCSSVLETKGPSYVAVDALWRLEHHLVLVRDL